MEYVKISKVKARKLFLDGESVLCLPSKVRVDSAWWKPAEIPKDSDFDRFCSSYSWYNCSNEVGKSISFYTLKNI